MARSRHVYTPAEDAILRARYRHGHGAALARELGLPVSSVYNRAFRLGLMQSEHLTKGQRRSLLALIKRKHKLGWSDSETAAAWNEAHPERPVQRRLVGTYRELIGLPHNALSEHRRARVAAKTKEQLRKAGLPTLAAVRVDAFAKFARRYGWPEDLRPRSVQILNALHQLGPMTRREICAAVGMPWKGSRASLASNDPEGSYVAHLMARGLVVRLARNVKTGRKKGAHCHRYSLAVTAIPRSHVS